MQEVTLKVTQERMRGMKVGVLRKLENSVSAQFAFIALFMVDADGNYMDEAAAYEILDEVELGEIEEIAGQLKDSLEAVAVPKASKRR
jgi:hypothetical protein